MHSGAKGLERRYWNMREAITYRKNTATAEQIRAHLMACDTAFIPPLSTRVTIADYARKLAENAQRVEAWAGEILVGFAALYANRPPQGFVSNVSVMSGHQRQGIAAELLRGTLEQAVGAGLALLTLEVATDNAAAIALYRAHGFVMERKTDTGTMIMTKELHGTELQS